jgi:hypothetical protein
MIHYLATSLEEFSNVLAVLAPTLEKFFYLSLSLNKCAVSSDTCKYCIVCYSTCSHLDICKIACCSRIDLLSLPFEEMPNHPAKETMSLEPLLNAVRDIFTLNYKSIINQPCC